MVEWFSRHDEFNTEQGVPYRDMYDFWQWGITQKDIITTLAGEGFELVYLKRYGAFDRSKPWVVNDGMIFERSRSAAEI